MIQSKEPGLHLVRMSGRVLVVAVYLLGLAFGILCVLYHVFFIWYSSLDGDPVSLVGVMLALANLIYPACIAGLLGSALAAKRWKSLIFKPQVWVTVVLMIPVIFYINFVLVQTLLPYSYSL